MHKFLFVICYLLVVTSCKVYTFKDVSIPPDIKTVKLILIENRAPYINTQLAPRLNDRLQQKIVNQTRLSRTNNDEADYVISGYISDYSVSTSGISNQQASINRLNVGVHITLKNNKEQKTSDYDINKSFEFPATLTINQVESSLTDDIVKGVSDEIFNRLFSNW